jgi:molybdate transport system substrate-binding protein
MRYWHTYSLPGQFLILLACLPALVTACTGRRSQPARSTNQAAPRPLTIFAAASLTEAFTKIGERFESSYPGADLTINFAGSQQLAQQLAQGAPADVFASANLEQMDAVIEQGRVWPGSQQVFARNRLVVVADSGAEDGVQQLQDLAKPGTILVLAGEAVPAGKYARQFLDKAGQNPAFGPGFEQAVLANVVSYEENVRAVLSKVILGEADAGIVYASDTAGVPEGQVRVIEIPQELNIQASYYIGLVRDAGESDLAEAFIRFLLSNEGQQILSDHGLQRVDQP